MDEYTKQETEITKLTTLEIIEPNATMADAKRVLSDMPSTKVVSLHDIYRVIAGHSYYHGDRILAALSCIAEGKEVNPIRPTDAVPVVYGQWEWFDEETGTPLTGYEREWGWRCSHCKHELPDDYNDPDCRPTLNYCSNCGAKMNENS